MGLFNNIFGRAEVEAQTTAPTGEQSVSISPQRPLVNRIGLRAGGLRPGMWVKTMGQVGIVTACSADGIPEVTFANGDGTTKMVIDETGQKLIPARVSLPASEITQAHIEDIPESRRPTVDALRSMGYKNKSEA